MSTKTLVGLGIALLLIVGFVYWYTLAPASPPQAQQHTGLANPASVNCINLGGELQIVDDAAAGGQVGYCHFKDGRVCEEWALMRDGSCVGPAH